MPLAEYIRNLPSPRDALKEAKRFQEHWRPDWMDVNIGKMEEVLYYKFTQHPALAQELIDTGDAILVEASPVDAFWGMGPDRKGKNELGRALMRLRGRLSSGQK